jgi:hypothetical protein
MTPTETVKKFKRVLERHCGFHQCYEAAAGLRRPSISGYDILFIVYDPSLVVPP